MKGELFRMIRRWTGSRVLGLDIEGPRLNYAEVSEQDGTLILRLGGSIPIVEGQTAEALKSLAAQINPADVKVACALSSPEIIVRPFHFPHISSKQLQQAIGMEAEAAVLGAHPLSEMAIDWRRTKPVSGGALEGVLAVAPKSLIADSVGMLKKAGFRPAVVDVKALALWNAFWQLTPHQKRSIGPVLLINITDDTTDLIIAQGRQELFLMRCLAMGAHAASEEWLSEIRDSLAYAQSQSGFQKVRAVYITGSGAQGAIAGKLTPVLDLQVSVWNPLNYLHSEQYKANPTIFNGCGLSVAVGLALRDL